MLGSVAGTDYRSGESLTLPGTCEYNNSNGCRRVPGGGLVTPVERVETCAMAKLTRDGPKHKRQAMKRALDALVANVLAGSRDDRLRASRRPGNPM